MNTITGIKMNTITDIKMNTITDIKMNTITGIKDLDTYLVLFLDQNTIYNYSILSKDTNQITSGHRLFNLLKEYYENNIGQTMLTWAIIENKVLILDWHMNIGYKFEHTYLLVDVAIIYAKTQILDWFYQKGICHHTLASLRFATLNGFVDVVDWFYDHGLDTQYLDKLLSKPEYIIDNEERYICYYQLIDIYHSLFWFSAWHRQQSKSTVH